jgi:hypothetical protein
MSKFNVGDTVRKEDCRLCLTLLDTARSLG